MLRESFLRFSDMKEAELLNQLEKELSQLRLETMLFLFTFLSATNANSANLLKAIFARQLEQLKEKA